MEFWNAPYYFSYGTVAIVREVLESKHTIGCNPVFPFASIVWSAIKGTEGNDSRARSYDPSRT